MLFSLSPSPLSPLSAFLVCLWACTIPSPILSCFFSFGHLLTTLSGIAGQALHLAADCWSSLDVAYLSRQKDKEEEAPSKLCAAYRDALPDLVRLFSHCLRMEADFLVQLDQRVVDALEWPPIASDVRLFLVLFSLCSSP